MKNKAKKRNVTLYLNPEVYDLFVDYCKKEGYAVSRKIEILMEEQLEKSPHNRGIK